MTYETHDSGERAEFDSGMVRDTNKDKPRFDLCVPLDVPHQHQMLTRWAALMARGAEKYGDRNWELAEGEAELNRFRDSAFRHFMMWFDGVSDGEDHAAAVFFNVTAAEYVKRKLKYAELRDAFLRARERGSGRPDYIIKFDQKLEPGDAAKLGRLLASALNAYRKFGGRL